MTNENLEFTAWDTTREFERCKQDIGNGVFKPYLCPAGVLTIGWGHTNHHGRKFDFNTRWTKAECDTALLEDMRGFEREVKRVITVDLTQGQYDACVDTAFNIGAGGFGGSTLLKKINRSDFDGAASEFGKWVYGNDPKTNQKVKYNGLVRRRAHASLMFQGIPDLNFDGVADLVDAEGGMPQAVNPPEPPKSTASSKTVQTAATVGTAVETGAVHEISKEIVVTAAPPDTSMFEHMLDLVVSNVDRIMRSPWLWIGILAAMGVGYIIFDRHKKLREENI